MNKLAKEIVATVAGLGFLTSILIIALVVKCPTQFQYNIFRILLSVFILILVSALGFSGEFKASFKFGVKATGAAAIFAVIFFNNPKEILDYSRCDGDCTKSIQIKGNVKNENGDNLLTARITFRGIALVQNFDAETNSKGDFSIDLVYYCNKANEPIKYEIEMNGFKKQNSETDMQNLINNKSLDFVLIKK